jgi:hypothetical protein
MQKLKSSPSALSLGLLQPDLKNIFSGYPERTSSIECGIPAAGDHLISRLEAAPTKSLSNGTWTFQISRISFL